MRLFLFVPCFFAALTMTAFFSLSSFAQSSPTTSKTPSSETSSSPSSKTPTPSQKKLIILGDSLTEGYGVAKESAFPALLEKKIQDSGKKEWSIVNAGVSGSTTASAIGRMKWLFKSKPDVLLITLGANDGLRGLKVEESEKNLSKAIEFAQAEKVTVVLGGLYMPPNYGKDYTEKFRNMYSSLAKKHKVKLIPFILDKVAGDPKYNLSDGIHPNEAGHKIIADHLYQEIKGLL